MYGTQLESAPWRNEAKGHGNSVIGEVSLAPLGNLVLRVGYQHLAPEGETPGWTQTEHVVLTPEEAKAFLIEAMQKLDILEIDLRGEPVVHRRGWPV